MSQFEDITSSQFDQWLQQATLRPFVVECYGENCSSCVVVERLLEQMLDTGDLRLPVFKVNVDKHPAFAQRYGIRGLPTLLAVKSDASIAIMPAMPNRLVIEKFIQSIVQ